MGDARTSQGDRKDRHLEALVRKCSREGRPRGPAGSWLEWTGSSPGSPAFFPRQASWRDWRRPRNTPPGAELRGCRMREFAVLTGSSENRVAFLTTPMMAAFLWTAGRCRLAKDLAPPGAALPEFLPELTATPVAPDSLLGFLKPHAVAFCLCCCPSAWTGKLCRTWVSPRTFPALQAPSPSVSSLFGAFVLFPRTYPCCLQAVSSRKLVCRALEPEWPAVLFSNYLLLK